jgi:hypothetical protein
VGKIHRPETLTFFGGIFFFLFDSYTDAGVAHAELL